MDEKQLVKSAKKGDAQAFSKLYGIYKDRLYRYAYYRLGNADDALDAVSDCVLSAYEEIKNLKNPAAFPAWIFKILYSKCSVYIHRLADGRNIADIAEYEDAPLSVKDINTDKTELQEALEILSDSERDIVLLCVVAGLNSREAGRLTGLAPGSVRSKLSRSLSKMRDFLER